MFGKAYDYTLLAQFITSYNSLIHDLLHACLLEFFASLAYIFFPIDSHSFSHVIWFIRENRLPKISSKSSSTLYFLL